MLLFIQIFLNLFSRGKGRDAAHALYADSSGSISVPESLFYDVLGKISLRGDAAHEDPGKETAPESVSCSGSIHCMYLVTRLMSGVTVEEVFCTVSSQSLDDNRDAVLFHKRGDVLLSAYEIEFLSEIFRKST